MWMNTQKPAYVSYLSNNNNNNNSVLIMRMCLNLQCVVGRDMTPQCSTVVASLIPRLPGSGMQTLKLAGGDSLVFFFLASEASKIERGYRSAHGCTHSLRTAERSEGDLRQEKDCVCSVSTRLK